MPCQISMKKSYQYSAHGISQLSYVWLGWSGIFLCHSYVTLANVSVSFFTSHITLANISVSSTSHTTVASFRRLTHWQKPWHQYTPHTPHFIFTRVQPTIWMYGSIYEVYIQSKFQTSQKWKFSVSGAQTGAVSAMLKVTYLLVIARLFTRLRFSTSLLVRLFISFRFSCQRGAWCQELFKNYISPRAC